MAKALLWVALAALLSQNLLIPVAATATFDDQKTYYTPDPHTHTPPTVSHSPPPHSSGGGHATPTPSHGTPPYHGGGGSPPANCGTPPSSPHHHHHTPSPSPPSGGYYNPPTPTPTPTTPTPTTPTPTTPTPTTPTYTPTPPTTITPPTTPIDPGTPSTPSPPSITFPSPPFPISPPFTCIYWRNHPTLIWGLFGWFGTVGGALGVPSGAPGLGSNMNLLEALSNTRTDGFGELYREGTAALLNSMSHGFPYTSSQVQNSFVAALSSNKAATAQARLFKLANEGKIKPSA